MKSYWMHIADVANPIELRDAAVPEAGPTQALVRVHAAGLNRGEFIKGHGLHGSQGAKAIGMEAAGEIVAIGDKVASCRTLKWAIASWPVALEASLNMRSWTCER